LLVERDDARRLAGLAHREGESSAALVIAPTGPPRDFALEHLELLEIGSHRAVLGKQPLAPLSVDEQSLFGFANPPCLPGYQSYHSGTFERSHLIEEHAKGGVIRARQRYVVRPPGIGDDAIATRSASPPGQRLQIVELVV
jgi:hypothetical protein